ncbi:kinesin-like protein KIF6 [Anneissia japonica]|uniref:kinesin-like protein KIF6 n=2 Tax=Anneissia japonica TaxID=1529436 RepID=UPI0014258771|nr:kinesin-like protein KIF6 [Anneissia japonica]
MVKQGIRIYCRVKPTKSKVGLYDIEEDEENYSQLSFVVPRELAAGFINNKKQEYKFAFESVFDQKAKQEEIFDKVAKGVLENALQGYNGTIFAYGQTGSGKTFTVTGGAEKYSDRGIIPRSLSYLFEQYQNSSAFVFTTHISYLEIYNEHGYDLLDPKHEATKLEDLPKVSLMEDGDQNIHLKNLSIHPANNEEEALNLLFLGDTNRMIAETPMNQASTRSHCIFTIHISARETGSATIRRAKVHLVDLAGSERVGKTGVGGTLLTEAKYINLSLHYLEQVIVALSEKTRQHIPYRNSMMTSVLRDSLGGNCMTTMIATCSVEKKNIDESISTCRFAQRVAMIKNDALLNEEIDPKLMIARLKGELQSLKGQLALVDESQSTDPLTEEEITELNNLVENYLEDPDTESYLKVPPDIRKINQCFKIFKRLVKKEFSDSNPERRQTSNTESLTERQNSVDTVEVKKLTDIIRQRDNEINILVNMLKKEKKKTHDAFNKATTFNDGENKMRFEQSHSSTKNQKHSNFQNSEESSRVHSSSYSSLSESSRVHSVDASTRQSTAQISSQRRENGEPSSLSSSSSFHLQNSKRILDKLKGQIEHYRMQCAMQAEPNAGQPDEIEQKLRHDMENEKQSYKVAFNRLKSLKSEIEHLQHLLEKSRLQLQKDFEMWWAEQTVALEAKQDHKHPSPAPPRTPSNAWRTPPVSPLKPLDQSGTSIHTQPSQYQKNSTQPVESKAESGRRTSHRQQRNALLAGLASQGHRDFGSTESSSHYRSGSSANDSSYHGNSTDTQSSRRSKSSSAVSSSAVQLTGDKRADADIMAFIKARQNLLKQRDHNSK